MTDRLASQRAMPIVGAEVPDVEPNTSHSPVELPTPPDEVALGPDVGEGPSRSAPGKSLGTYYPLFASHHSFGKPVSSTLGSLYRASQLDPASKSAFRYAGFRPAGLSSFQMSAERGTCAPSESAVEDTDMNVDDVFSVASQRDTRRAPMAVDETEPMAVPETSPGFAPHSLDNDDAIPPLEASSHGHPPVPVPNMPSSWGSRRSSLRSIGSPVDNLGFSTNLSSSTRRVPYNIPSRSPGTMGPLSQAYAMGMTPSNGVGRSAARFPPWTSAHRFSRRMQMSTSAPTYAGAFAFDEDETDDETGALDDDATEDEVEFERDGRPSSYSRSSSPVNEYEEDDGWARQRSQSRSRDDRFAYAGRRAPSGLAHAHAVPSGRAVPHAIAPYASSLPARGYTTYAPGWSGEDHKQRMQIHMAAAALDRLSMTNEHEEQRESEPSRAVDENDEVAAIRDRLGGAANCSAFISKLWHLMINPDLYGKYIHWNEAGDTIILNNDPEIAAEFAAHVLPKLFKHGNNASFVRQLNLYGFQRVSSSRLLDAVELQVLSAKGLGERSNLSVYGRSPTTYTAAELYGAHSSFAHPRFRRGQEQGLASMKPRSSKKPKRPAEDKT